MNNSQYSKQGTQNSVPAPFLAHPAVCSAGVDYVIVVCCRFRAIVGVRVAGREYWSQSNGVKISDTKLHKINVPRSELDREGGYTVIYRRMLKRLPYRPVTGRQLEYKYGFRPVPAGDKVGIYHVADAHGMREEPASLAARHDDIDLLVLNGDVINSSETETQIFNHYFVASDVTKGTIPCVISRGNHDLRGRLAERLGSYMPTVNGRFYYTFRAGDVWGMVLDTFEDKPDDHVEYGGVTCCHERRLEETGFIKDVIARAEEEYAAPGVRHRLIISHVPIATVNQPPFDIEKDLYSEWCRLMTEHIRPTLMLGGHWHQNRIVTPDSELNHLGAQCTVVWASEHSGKKFSSAHITLDGDEIKVTFDYTYKESETHSIISN